MKFTSTSERELSNSSAGGGNSRLVRGFTKKDLLFSIATGLITGIIAWQIFVFLGVFEKLGFEIRPAVMILVVPILWILGVNLGYFLADGCHFSINSGNMRRLALLTPLSISES